MLQSRIERKIFKPLFRRQLFTVFFLFQHLYFNTLLFSTWIQRIFCDCKIGTYIPRHEHTILISDLNLKWRETKNKNNKWKMAKIKVIALLWAAYFNLKTVKKPKSVWIVNNCVLFYETAKKPRNRNWKLQLKQQTA